MTTIEQSALRAVKMLISENSYWLKVVDDYRDKLRLGFFKKEYVDSLFQVDGRFDIEFHHAYSFSRVHSMIMAGKVAHAKVYVGSTPVSDSWTEEMNRRLSLLVKPFSAHFHGGTQGADGYVNVSEPIYLCVTNEKTGEIAKDKLRFVNLPIPLEVGTTSICKTHYYLCGTHGCLARWPYDSEWIYIWQTDKRFLDERSSFLDQAVNVKSSENYLTWCQLSLNL